MEIENAIELIQDSRLQEQTWIYFYDLCKRGFNESPGNMHHAYPGGLRDHVEEMLDIGINILSGLQFDFEEKIKINLDHLIIATIFHDAGKVGLYKWVKDHYEFDESTKAFTEPTSDPSKTDHAFIPMIEWKALGLSFPDEIEIAILGHMGGWSVTGVYPDTLLGAILSSADLISSRLEHDWVIDYSERKTVKL